MIKIMIADDQKIIRDSLEIILSANSDFKIVSLVENGNEVLNAIKKEVPDVILMDIRMPEMDGVVCTKFVKKMYPEIKIIILTTFDDDEYIYHALKYGASGYLLKGMDMQSLSDAIYTVVEGGSIIHPKAATKLFKFFSEEQTYLENQDETIKDTRSLNDKEWDVIENVSYGLSNKEISQKLHFSEGTVRNYLSIILDKLNFRDRTQLAIWYIQEGKRLRKVDKYER